MFKIATYVTGPAQTMQCGHKCALLLNESYLGTGIEYFYSVTIGDALIPLFSSRSDTDIFYSETD